MFAGFKNEQPSNNLLEHTKKRESNQKAEFIFVWKYTLNRIPY